MSSKHVGARSLRMVSIISQALRISHWALGDESKLEDVTPLAQVRRDHDLAHAGVGQHETGVFLLQAPVAPFAVHLLDRLHVPVEVLHVLRRHPLGDDVGELLLIHVALRLLRDRHEPMPDKLMGHGPRAVPHAKRRVRVLQGRFVAHLDEAADEIGLRILLYPVETQVAGPPGLLDHLLGIRRDRHQLHFQLSPVHLSIHEHSFD